MTLSDWAFLTGIKVIDWLNPLIHVIGLTICVWAYRVSRERGYLIVAVYFFLAAGGLLLGPTISTLTDRSRTSELSPEADQRYQEEISAVYQKYFPSPNASATLNIRFPLGPIVLVSGLWILARRDCKRITKPVAAPNGEPAVPHDNSGDTEGPPSVS